MKSFRTLLLALCAGSLLALSTPAISAAVTSADREITHPQTPAGMWVPDARAAFDHLSRKPDPLGIQRTGAALEPGEFKHYQGIARVNAADGTPYFVITKGGVGGPVSEDQAGYLTVARMGSRDRDGERLRTNLNPNRFDYDALAPDQTVLSIALDGTNGWPSYRHPGGMQLVGHILAIGADTPFNGETAEATILFVDVENPEEPRYIGKFDPPDPSNGGFGTDPVGITAIKNPNGTCCLYMMVAAGGAGNEQVRFFESVANRDDGSTDLSVPTDWVETRRVHADTSAPSA